MKNAINKVEKVTIPSNAERLNQLKQLFPECLTEGEVDLGELNKILNIYKAGGGVMRMIKTKLIASPGRASMMLFAFLIHPQRQH